VRRENIPIYFEFFHSVKSIYRTRMITFGGLRHLKDWNPLFKGDYITRILLPCLFRQLLR